MRRMAVISVLVVCGLVACGAPQVSQSRTATSDPAGASRDTHDVTETREAEDEVDREPGHDEPDDNEASIASSPRQPDPVHVRRAGEPDVAPDAPILETLEGRVSYYSDRLAGRSTASGEPYRLEEFTAASRDLPFGTLVRVVRLSRASGEELGSVVVRVNDRGPFGDHSRILDLSRAAAEALNMVRAGVVPVRAEILRRGR